VELTTLLQIITTVAAVVASIALVILANETRETRILLAKLLEGPFGRPSSSHTWGMPGPPGGFSIYVFRNGRWELESDLSAPGFEPSPPTIPGSFEGHVIKKQSRPAGEP
jgi:hypothetical protein